ncbi:hypothetical protein HBH92_066770 [Parastagonospora nodorum]|nr:hypothetical protein HBH92_066770 [Parastagonospora nodorum]KAH4444307.1 hypothetical protein HBH93_065650 [Parastagonospora nodorum]KAH4456637.1 hypothetical protein HBH91_098410 [Parastagonospora nodorum]KAH4493465.1 hypothetical protein HBH89_160870 [Parastagonospora nodorum]KAH4545216.1 hypothetical protein HBH85_089540 [Parastagonospora nodorum]
MDPLSITLACVTLIGVVSKVSTSLRTLSRDFRDAPSELKATDLELSSVQAVLVNLTQQTSGPGGVALLSDLEQHVINIIKHCSVVVADIETCLQKHMQSRRGVSGYWLLGGGKDELARHRSSLEAHKSALQITLQMLAVNSLRNIVRNTAPIPQIQDDMRRFFKELEQLRARIPTDEAQNGISKALSATLDDMASQFGAVRAHGDKNNQHDETDSDGGWDSDTACINGPAPLSQVSAKSMAQAKVPKPQSPRRTLKDPDHGKRNRAIVTSRKSPSPQSPSLLLLGSVQPKNCNNQRRLTNKEILQHLLEEGIPQEPIRYTVPPKSPKPKSQRLIQIRLRQTAIPEPYPDPYRPFEFPEIMRYVASQPWTLYLGRNAQRKYEPDFIDLQTPGVSEVHCKIWLEDGSWFVEDVQRASCTWLNGTWLTKKENEAHPLKHGDHLELGYYSRWKGSRVKMQFLMGWMNGADLA